MLKKCFSNLRHKLFCKHAGWIIIEEYERGEPRGDARGAMV